MEPVCLVCTDPLKLAAVGKCGHKNVCAKCILRLRLVLRTSECPECKEENDEVLVTTAAGSLTARPGSQPLADRAKEGDLACLDKRLPDRSPRTGMYFEDPVQMEELREKAVAKCSYPPCTKGKKEFRTVKQLEGHLWNEHGLNLCEVCLRSRRAFLQEQTLYTQQQLKHHKRHGSERDENTELGRAGFSGHPLCEFCTQRFFDSTEFFHHMEREHFRCPLCKRSDESDWTYYANYDHLERHFRSCHYLCTHSQCLERKFVVFATEAELTRHQLTEHGRKLSQTEKRQALRIDVDFNFRRAEEGQRVSPPLEGNGDQPRVAAHLPRSQPHAPAPPTDSGNEGELPQRHEDGSSSENASKPAGQSWVAAAKGRAPGRPAVRRRRQRGSDNSDAEEFPALSASTSYRNGDATSRQGESWQASSAVHRRQSSENEAAGGGTPAPGSRRSESKRERSKALRGPPPGFEGPDLGNGVDAEVFRRVGNAGYSFFKEVRFFSRFLLGSIAMGMREVHMGRRSVHTKRDTWKCTL